MNRKQRIVYGQGASNIMTTAPLFSTLMFAVFQANQSPLLTMLKGNREHTEQGMNNPLRGGGRYTGFQVTGIIERGQKSKPKKLPRASNKAPENPWTKN